LAKGCDRRLPIGKRPPDYFGSLNQSSRNSNRPPTHPTAPCRLAPPLIPPLR
jgi:hypothetical protein